MKFSIIIPVYNAVNYLRPCLDSVLNQTERDWDCICVDDGSTDASGAILDEYAARDARFNVIHQRNQGVAVARNVGLDAARGEWITWLDADDVYASWRLEEAGRIIRLEDPDVVRFRTHLSDRIDHSVFCRRAFRCFTGPEIEPWCWNVMVPSGMMWTMVVRRSLFEGVRFLPGMRIKEEFSVCAQLALKVKKAVQSESVAYVYRQVPQSAIHVVRHAEDSIRLLEAIHSFYVRHPNLSEVARCRLRMHCEDDIKDWVWMSRGELNRSKDIYDVYIRLEKAGLFDCPSIMDWWPLEITLWWWKKTGQTWALSVLGRLVFCMRGLRKGRAFW